MTQPLRAVFFDVNHTLIGIRDEQSCQSAAVDVLFGETAVLAGEPIRRTRFREAYDLAWTKGKRASFERYQETRYEDIVATTLAQFGIDLGADELDRVLQTYMEPLLEGSYMIPGVEEVLTTARACGAKVGAITNYKYANGMREMARRVGLLDLLDSMTISSEVGWKKPDKRIYLEASKSLGHDPSESLFIGNEVEKDLWTASELGMKTVLFMPSEHDLHDAEFAEVLRGRIDTADWKPDWDVSSARAMVELLSGLLKGSGGSGAPASGEER